MNHFCEETMAAEAKVREAERRARLRDQHLVRIAWWLMAIALGVSLGLIVWPK
jgi:hypothetical protein